MASTNGCVEFTRNGGMAYVLDAKLRDPLWSGFAARGPVARMSLDEYEVRLDLIVAWSWPWAIFGNPMVDGAKFTRSEMLALAVYAYWRSRGINRLALAEGGVVTAWGNMRDFTIKQQLEALQSANWVEDGDPETLCKLGRLPEAALVIPRRGNITTLPAQAASTCRPALALVA